MHQLKKKEYSFAILVILCFAILPVLASGAAAPYRAPPISTYGTISTPTYRGMQTAYGLLTSSDVQTIQSYGGTDIDFNGCPYSDLLPSPVTNQNQISSSVFATLDTYAGWAETYQIPVIFTFVNLADATYGQVPNWMLSLAGGNAGQLELGYFNGNSTFNSVRTSITCLWQAMANRYMGNPYVIFDFFNEPFYSNTVVTPSNYRTLESDYSSVITSLVDTVRAINSTRLILVDTPFMVYDDINYGTIPIDIPRNIIWNFHCYANSLATPPIDVDTGWNSWEHYYIDAAVSFFVTHLGKQLFIGEYGYVDNNGNELNSYPNWQWTLTTEVAYLRTLPLWGYQWNSYPWLYGKAYNLGLISQGHTDTYTASNSTWILNTVLHP